MKYTKKVIFGVIAVLVVTAIFVTGFYQKHKLKKGTWEEEFYHCVMVMEERLDNMDAEPLPSTWSDEAERVEKREIRANAWKAYMNFVEVWIEQEGDTQQAKEEIYKKATLLIVLLHDNYNMLNGLGDYEGEPHQLAYYHEVSQSELLAGGNQALQEESIIDINIAQLKEEFEKDDHYGQVYGIEADAWKKEFQNCLELIETRLADQTGERQEYVESKEAIELWEKLIGQWLEYSMEYAQIGAGSGLNLDQDRKEGNCYRTATLLMITYYEKNYGTYEFVYDAEATRETLIDWIYP